MPKSSIRPPRAPKGEAPSVTIANQARHIRNLLARVQEVAKERDEARKELRSAIDRIGSEAGIRDEMATEIVELELHVAKLGEVNTRLLGWQDCAREIIDADGGKI